jgi:hypothetical protein
MEQFANNCSTTVTSAYTAGDGHIHVADTGSPWPQSGDFRISIFDAVSNELKVTLKVTAIPSATEWTVTAEGTDANAAVGNVVVGTVLTAEVMQLLIPTYVALSRPVLADLTWVNQGGSSASQNTDTIFLSDNSNTGSENVSLLKKSASSPLIFTVKLGWMLHPVNYNQIGIAVREFSSGKFITIAIGYSNGFYIGSDKWNSATSYSGALGSYFIPSANPCWLRMRVTSGSPGTIYAEYSVDGINWTVIASQSVGTFITPDEVGICSNRVHNSGPIAASIQSLSVV